MKKFSVREKIIGGVCVLVCLVFFVKNVWVFVVAEHVNVYEDRIKSVSVKLAKARAELKGEVYYEKKFETLKTILGEVESESVAISLITSRIDAFAKEENVRLVNVRSQKAQEEKYYSMFPVEVVFDGEWQNVARFLWRLSDSSERMDLLSVRLEKSLEQSSELHGNLVVAKLCLLKK